MNKLIALFFALQCMAAFAEPQTVDDSACFYYGAEIANFATCEGDLVAKPAPENVPTQSPASKGNPVPAKTSVIPRDTHAIAKADLQKVAQRQTIQEKAASESRR
jgi:hypothetical protein